MLAWIETDLDFSRIADAPALLARETDALLSWHAGRNLLRCWRRVNGRGWLGVVDFADAALLDDALNALPTFGALQGVAITPLVPHRRFGEFAAWRDVPGSAAGQLYHVRLAIDRARLEPARTHDLLERAEANARRHIDEGQVVGIWREPHGNGACMAWCVRDAQELHHELDALPLKGFMRGVHVEPVLPMAGLEALAGWTR